VKQKIIKIKPNQTKLGIKNCSNVDIFIRKSEPKISIKFKKGWNPKAICKITSL